MLLGVRSPWTRPRRAASASACASGPRMVTTSDGVQPAAAASSAGEAAAGGVVHDEDGLVVGELAISRTPTTCGPAISATTPASRRSRSTGRRRRGSQSRFSATGSPVASSRPRQTSPVAAEADQVVDDVAVECEGLLHARHPTSDRADRVDRCPQAPGVPWSVGREMIRAGVVGYDEAWAWQRELHAARVAGEIEDTVLLLEHPSVYTAGRRTEAWERPIDGTPVIDVDRGGKITWHGPGQLTGYPIVALPDPIDVVGHVRRLEGALLDGVRRARGRGAARSRAAAASGCPPTLAGRSARSRRSAYGSRAASRCTASR